MVALARAPASVEPRASGAPLRVPPLAAIEAERAERRLAHFVRQAWPVIEPGTPYRANWHIDAICAHLEAVARGEIRNLLINMPPRMMKSIAVSVMFPAWVWLRAPEKRFLYSSYSASLATAHSLATRRVVASDWYRARWGDRFALAGDQNLKTRFENDQRGELIATSVGGLATGTGGDFVVVDDPHNVQEAESDAVRRSTLEWWDRVMSTRLNDPKTGARIIVMQRVHHHDLAGHVLAQGGYEHLCLPMEYEPTDRVTGIGWADPRTAPGELLWPDRVGPAEVADLQVRMGARAYAGQQQQRPAPAAGDLIKRAWIRRYRRADLPVRFDLVAQSWDLTFKRTDAGSFVVGQVWGALGARRWLLDQFRARVDFPGTLAAMRALRAAWPATVAVLVEDQANGPAVLATLADELPGLIPVHPQGGKASRLNAVAPLFEAGDVLVPEDDEAPWVAGWVEEVVAAPNGAHDDQPDAASQALTWLHRRGGEAATADDVRAALEAGLW